MVKFVSVPHCLVRVWVQGLAYMHPGQVQSGAN